jgi:large subunit ribosomal protein L29
LRTMANEMNTVTAQGLRDRNEAEMLSLLGTKQEELQKLRFKQALRQPVKTHEIVLLRRDIARLNTVLTEKRKGIVVVAKAKPVKTPKPKAEKKAAAEVEAAPKKKAPAKKAEKAEKSEKKAPAKKTKAKG